VGTEGWRAETIRGVTLLRCGMLADTPGVAHAFSTRRADGAADFDLGGANRDTPEWNERRRRFHEAAGIAGPPAILAQVHGKRIVRAKECVGGRPPEADGVLALASDRPRVAPAVRTADCVPVLLADLEGRAVAAVHAGWRGTARGIVRAAVERLELSGVEARALLAAIGPAIGACCYEVSDDVASRVAAACGCPPASLTRPGPRGRPLLDLREANRFQLREAGLADGAISVASWCTACNPDLLFSYRSEERGSGRLMACIGWTGDGSATVP
jgi:YfiH family protein